MRILVTGASGFVGQALLMSLSQRGILVRAANRRDSKTIVESNYVVGDIGANTDWRQAMRDCDVVVHLGARVHVLKECADDSLSEFRKTNVEGTRQLAIQAAKAGVKRMVFISSVKVNGERTVAEPFTESDQPQPQDAYAISKWEAEQALRKISQETGMEVVIVRPPLVYGSRVKANFLKLLELVDQGIPLPLGAIQNSRSLIYVGNLIDALITCATHPAAAGQTYFVSDREDVSTPQLVDAIANALHRRSRVFPFPVTLMQRAAALIGKSAAIDRLIQSLVIDSSKIHNELGWQPPYTMAQGLQATADWYRHSVKSRQA